MSVCFQVLAGMEMIDLKGELGFVQGGKRGQKPHDAVFASWGEYVAAELGISDDTARRWMDMGKAIKPRLKKLGGELERLPLALPQSEWKPEQHSLLEEAVKKMTDGETMASFMMELGLAKKPAGSSGGKREKDGAKTPDDPAEVAKDLIFNPMMQVIANDFDDHYGDLPDALAHQLGEQLSEAARKLAAVGGKKKQAKPWGR
jgi:hypothetical protein